MLTSTHPDSLANCNIRAWNRSATRRVASGSSAVLGQTGRRCCLSETGKVGQRRPGDNINMFIKAYDVIDRDQRHVARQIASEELEKRSTNPPYHRVLGDARRDSISTASTLIACHAQSARRFANHRSTQQRSSQHQPAGSSNRINRSLVKNLKPRQQPCSRRRSSETRKPRLGASNASAFEESPKLGAMRQCRRRYNRHRSGRPLSSDEDDARTTRRRTCPPALSVQISGFESGRSSSSTTRREDPVIPEYFGGNLEYLQRRDQR